MEEENLLTISLGTYKKCQALLLIFFFRQSQFVFNQTSNEQTSITFLNYDGNTLYVRL